MTDQRYAEIREAFCGESQYSDAAIALRAGLSAEELREYGTRRDAEYRVKMLAATPVSRRLVRERKARRAALDAEAERRDAAVKPLSKDADLAR